MLLPSAGSCSRPDGCGREELLQPLAGLVSAVRQLEAGGTVAPASEPTPETSQPHDVHPLPSSPCCPLSLPVLPWFHSPLRISALGLPGESRLLAREEACCWLGPCQRLDGCQGKGRTWGREIVAFGGSCSPKRLPGRRLCPA